MISIWFCYASIVGALGVILFVMGARAITEKDFAKMAKCHWWGVICLTASAAITFVDIGDASYLLMQLPFLIGAGKTWAEKTDRINAGNWWPLWLAVVSNGCLVTAGVVTGIVVSGTTFMQVLSASTVSSALAMQNKERMLWFLMLGRAGLFATSAFKLWIDPTNAASLVWTVLMGWAVIDNSVQLWKIQRAT